MGAILTLTVLGVMFGIILGLADKFLKVEVDSRITKINEMLPGFNCGACGHPGCAGLADAIVAGGGKVSDCKPIKAEQKEVIYAWMETSEAEGPNGEKFDLKTVK